MAALPVLFLVFLIYRYGVPIPALDDWEMAPLIIKAHQGGLTVYDLFEQQQESRTFFPKLIFIFLSFLRHWDSRVEMMLSVGLGCLSSCGIFLLLKRSGISAAGIALSFVLMVLLIFSPVQEELWLLASGFPSFIPALCIIGGLVIIGTNLSVRAKFFLCVALAFFSSFSLASGLLTWGLTFPVLLISRKISQRTRWLVAWILACGICAVIYFWRFAARPDLPPFAPSQSPFAYLQYLSVFLGSGLARSGNEHPLGVATGVGAFLFTCYLAVVVCVILRRKDVDYRARVFPWLALGMYSIGSGCLAALGRIHWGVLQALESRYVTFSLYLAVAVIALVAIHAREISREGLSARGRLGVFAGVVFLTATYLTLELLCAAASVPLFRLRSAAGHLGHGAVLFSQVLDTSETIKLVNFPRPEFVVRNAAAFDELRLLRTPLMRSRELAALRTGAVDDAEASGWFDGWNTEQGADTAWGWAALTGKGRPADGVVMAYANEKGEWIAFAFSNAVVSRPDVAKALRSSDQTWAGWRANFPHDAVPNGARISAWALDAKAAKLYRLRESGASIPLRPTVGH